MSNFLEKFQDKVPSTLLPKLNVFESFGDSGRDLVENITDFGELGALFLEQLVDIPDLNTDIIRAKLEEWFLEILSVTPSPYDSTDLFYEKDFMSNQESIKIPRTLDLRTRLGLPRNQGRRGTCAAFTAAGIKESQEYIDTGFKNYFSPEFVYWYRTTKPGAGMHGRNVMLILVEQGICTEVTLPYQKEDIVTIPEKARLEAANYKCESFAQINTIQGLKQSLVSNGACYISFPVYSHSPEIWRGTPGEKMRGGHAMMVVGWTSKGFIIRNSWGATWNDDGTVIYSFKEFLDKKHWDIWTTVDIKGSPTPPAPPTPKCKCIIL